MKIHLPFILLYILAASVPPSWSYPLDGDDITGIERLEGYRLVQEGRFRGPRLPAGARLSLQQIDLSLLDHQQLIMPLPDKDFVASIQGLVRSNLNRYAFAILDITDPENPRLAAHRASVSQNPGSVGKLIITLAFFQTLADIYPESIEARQHILRDTMVTADAFIRVDKHDVPFWYSKTQKLTHRPIQIGDRANLWTYLDWMLSASSNAAASMVLKECMLMAHFGKAYPVTETEATQFFKETPKRKLSNMLRRILQEPISRNGLNTSELQQGGFFTREGKRRVPGTTSHATPMGLLDFMLKLEKGMLVDTFSSGEIKRLLYMTQNRIRYASSPALVNGAVYYKSGSLYSCRSEPNFECEKYKGNAINILNSVAIVEAPANEPKARYIAVVMSNVLRTNSAWAHRLLATRIHEVILSYYSGIKAEPNSDSTHN